MNKNKFYKNIPTLETQRLILRKMNMKDINDIYEYASQEEVSQYVSWDTHKNIESTEGFINYVLTGYSTGEDGPWVIVKKDNRKVIGSIHIIRYDKKNNLCEIAYVLSKFYWNKGYMTEALSEVISFCFKILLFNRVQLICKEENIASARVMEKCGLKYEGLLREFQYEKNRYWNIKMYSILNH